MEKTIAPNPLTRFAGAAKLAAAGLLALVGVSAMGDSQAQAQTQPTFACDSTMYLSWGGGPTQMVRVDTSTNPFGLDDIGDPITPGFNGIGFDPNSNYIYAARWDGSVQRLIRIGSDGSVRDMGRIIGGGINVAGEGAGGFASGVIGADGFLYLKHNSGSASDRMFRVDLGDDNVGDRTATRIDLTLDGTQTAIASADLAWHNDRIYAHDQSNDRLYWIHPATGAITIVGDSNTGGGFGSLISATNGVFGRDNNGGFYQFDTATGEGTLISDSPTGGGDGAKCPITAVELDADLAIEKDDGSDAYDRGGQVVYTILVSNNGPFGVQNARVNDALPDGITEATWTCGSPVNGATCSVASGTGGIDDIAVNLPNNSSITFTLTMQVPLEFTGELTNTATVTAPVGTNDPDPSNNTDSDTNVAAPLLTLEKVVENENGGTATTDDFTLTADGPVSISGVSGSEDVTEVSVPAGTYTLSETSLPGYTADEWMCAVDGGAPIAGDNITLENEQEVVCTVTNRDEPATLTLQKTVVNNDGGIAEAEDFTLTADGPVAISGPTGDPSVTDVTVPAGIYTLGETGPPGYTSGDYRCSIDGGAQMSGNTLDIGNGQSAVCTVTNDDIPPDVTIEKELVDESGPNDNFPDHGEVLTYEITLTNTGGTASDYEVVDVLNDNVTFVSASHGGALVGNEVQWTLTVPAQDGATPGTLVLEVITQVINPLPAGQEVRNYAKTPTEPDPECPSAQCVVIPPPPFVESEKLLVDEDGSVAGLAEPGEQLTYEITLRNLGSTTSAYAHRDLLDENTIFVSANEGGAHSGETQGGEINWTNLTVPGGTPSSPGELVLTVVVDVVDPIPGGVSQITNVAYDPTQPPPECPSAECVVTPVPGIVAKSKQLVDESGSIDGVAEPGERLTYEITLTNTGGPVTDYEIEDRMDPNTVFVSADNGGTHVGSDSGGVVTWENLSIDAHDGTSPGTLVLTVEVDVVNSLDPGVTSLTNIVAEPGETVDCGDTPQQCVVTQTAPQISKTKALDQESGDRDGVAEPGETLTYLITVINEGGADPAYRLQDVLDPHTTFQGATGGGQLMGDHVAWTLDVPAYDPDAGAPGRREVTVTVRVDDPLPVGVTEITNIIREPGETVDCDVTPDQCVTTQTAPQISRTKELVGESGERDGVAEPGEELTYRITITNTGGADEPDYGLVDDYDDLVTVVDPDGGTDEGGHIRWTGLNVPAQTGGTPGTLLLTVVMLVDDPLPSGVASISNALKDDHTDPDPECPSDECVVITTSAQITQLKELVAESGETDGIAEPGEHLTYRITLFNEGGTTDDYALEDRLDPNTIFVSADNGGTHGGSDPGGVVTWSDLTVPGFSGGEPGTLELEVVVAVVDPLPDDVVEIGNVVARPGEPDPDCPSDQCAVVSAQQTGLTLLKEGLYEDSDGDGVASIGDTIRYSFTVTNTGNVPLSDVAPRDDGPTFDGHPGGGSLSAFTPQGVTLAPDEEQVFTAEYVLTGEDIDNGAGVEDGVQNTAIAIGYANGSAVTGTEVESDESLSVLALPAAASDVSVVKIAELGAIRRGEQAPFAIRLTNNSGARVDGITVTDIMPSGFRFVEGTASLDGQEVTPLIEGRSIIFENLSLDGNAESVIRLRLLALSSAGPGRHVNRARATGPAGESLAPEATAVIEILAEAVFDCGDIVGRVFDDINGNGYPDDGEPGLAGVRIATAKGWLVTTDRYGRFHVPCADLPDQRIGSNFIMKVDERTLPTGYRLTTENPRVVRLTAGKMTRLNFGATLGRVVRLDLEAGAFEAGDTALRPAWTDGVDQLVAILAEDRSVLRLTYFGGAGEDSSLIEARMRHMRELVTERWRRRGAPYPLDIETRVETGQ